MFVNDMLSMLNENNDTNIMSKHKVQKYKKKSYFNYRRLMRKAGVKRASFSMNRIAHGRLVAYLQEVIRSAIIICKHQKRTTITSMDLQYAFKMSENN